MKRSRGIAVCPSSRRCPAPRSCSADRTGFRERSLFQWGVALAETDEVIGTCTLFHFSWTHRRCELGFALAKERWSLGDGGRAARTILNFAFERLGLHRVEADADPRNLRSLALLTRLGFQREGLLRERYIVNGEVQRVSRFLRRVPRFVTASPRWPRACYLAQRMARFDLVIFDCDGVLVDSELIANRVFQTMLGELGLEVSMDYLFEKFLGHSMTHCLTLVRGLLGHELPADFEPRLRERTALAFEAELQPVPGIVATLSELTLPFCVASSGPHSKMRVSLGVTGLCERSGVVSALRRVIAAIGARRVLFAAERMACDRTSGRDRRSLRASRRLAPVTVDAYAPHSGSAVRAAGRTASSRHSSVSRSSRSASVELDPSVRLLAERHGHHRAVRP